MIADSLSFLESFGTSTACGVLFLVGLVAGALADSLAIGLRWTPWDSARSHWPRRIIIAVFFALFAVGYYYWEVVLQAAAIPNPSAPLYPDSLGFNTGAQPLTTGPESVVMLANRYGIHLVLAWFLLIATLTDFDDYIIPDALMIPATVIILVLRTTFPSTLPGLEVRVGGIAILIGGWLFWSFALLDRRWYPKLGFRRGWLLFSRRLCQSPLTPIMAFLAATGTILIAFLGRTGWLSTENSFGVGLSDAIIGMTIGMVTIWTVRVAGRLTLGREAMGFGDVVLMGLIGAAIGWRGAILVFFLAPFAGLVFGVIRAIFRTNREIPYGPFLSLATIFLLFFWPSIWRFVEPILSEGRFVAILLGFAAALFVILLGVLRLIKRFIFGVA